MQILESCTLRANKFLFYPEVNTFTEEFYQGGNILKLVFKLVACNEKRGYQQALLQRFPNLLN